MLRSCCISGDKGEVDVGCGHAGKVDFCLFCGFLNALHCHFIIFEVDSAFCLEGVADVVHYPLVKVVAAETVVTCGCENLLNAVAHFDNRNVKGAAAKVVYHYLLVIFLINAVCESSCCRLIDDTLNVESCDASCILCCLTLSVGKVSGNGDYSLGYG